MGCRCSDNYWWCSKVHLHHGTLFSVHWSGKSGWFLALSGHCSDKWFRTFPLWNVYDSKPTVCGHVMVDVGIVGVGITTVRILGAPSRFRETGILPSRQSATSSQHTVWTTINTLTTRSCPAVRPSTDDTFTAISECVEDVTRWFLGKRAASQPSQAGGSYVRD